MPFNGDRLRILRRFHNLTQREFGERIGSPASAVSGYEKGRTEPKGMTLDAICLVLNVEPRFFLAENDDDEFKEYQTHFRSLQSTSERLRSQMLAHATLFGVLVKYLASAVRLPTCRLPKLKASTPDELERAAERCRIDLGVGIDAPIQNVTHMLEHAGVMVTVLNAAISKKVDAFSRYGDTNLIVLNPAKGSPTRARMDVCHEAAHGTIHSEGLPAELTEREKQANYFAGALLLPQKAFGREFWAFGRRDWGGLLELKRRWGANVSAIVMRSYQLGLIGADEYKRRYRGMQKMGWLKGAEPDEPEAEKPQLFSLVLGRYQESTGKDTDVIAKELSWTPELFERIVGLPVKQSEDASIASFEEFKQRKAATN